MVNLPKEIADRLKILRSEHSHYVSVKILKGKHYAFEVTSKWNKDLQKSQTITHYLGRIMPDGTFIGATHRNYKGTLSAEKTIQTHETTQGKYDKIIIKNLSMNGRMSIPLLSKRLDLSITNTRYWANKIENLYGIRYFAEIDTERLGYVGYFIFIKFNAEVPRYEEIKQSIESEAYIQLAAFTSGEYDLILYILTKSPMELAYLIYNLRAKSAFNKYPSFWYTTPNYSRSHTIPLRDNFFEMLRNNIWHRTKEKPRPNDTDITEREYNILRELSSEGSIGFDKMDKKYRYGKGISRYAYTRLKEKGILKRVTINLERLNLKYTGVLFIDFMDMLQFKKTRSKLLLEAIKDTGVVNKYSLANDTGIPEGFLMVMPVFNEDELITTEDKIRQQIKGIRLRKLIVTKIILGSFCFRKFDMTYTNQYRLLVEEYKLIKEDKKTDYESDN